MTPDQKAYVDTAKHITRKHEEIEFDDKPHVIYDDIGAWVACWVYVRSEQVPEPTAKGRTARDARSAP